LGRYGSTVLEGLKATAGKGSTVDFMAGTDISGAWVQDKQQLVDRASQADVVVVCVGEPAYAEGSGNIEDLLLPQGQQDLVTTLASAGVPVVVVLLEGRPRLLGSIPSTADAVIHGYLPGPAGGMGIAEVIFGLTNPSGRLTHTYPKYQNTPLQYYRKVRQRDYK
jgi:beta-glucosidase